MAVLQALAVGDVRRLMETYRDALRAHQEELNRLNVYPVPDGDTGTNMALTVEAVCAELETTGGRGHDAPAMTDVCTAIAHGSLMGARGNSGVILSQILRGLAETFTPLESIDTRVLMVGLRRGADAAYEAVMRPVEGTILTAARSVAEAVEEAVDEGNVSLEGVLERAAGAARAAVEQSPHLLPVLAEAGVVDAGSRGFELLLHACLHVVAGRPLPEPDSVRVPEVVAAHHAGADDPGLRYEVMYLLHADDDRVPELRRSWSAIGDSIVVVGGDGIWNCHIHTNEIGAAIEAGIGAGRPERIRVTDLIEQVEELEEAEWVRAHHGETLSPLPHVATAVVAVAVGEGLRRLFESLGVQQVVAGGQSMNPSTTQILEAVRGCSADAVIVLPNNKNIVAVASQVAALHDQPVGVVPTTAVVEALGALVAYDPKATIDENLASMRDAAGRVRAGEVTQAVRDSVAECGAIAAGDWIAIVADGVCATKSSAVDATVALVDALVTDDAELVTLITGLGARASDTARIEEHLARAHPELEVELHEGDQPLYPYLVGVE